MNPRVVTAAALLAVLAAGAYFFLSANPPSRGSLAPDADQDRTGNSRTPQSAGSAEQHARANPPRIKAEKAAVDWEFLSALSTGATRPPPTAEDITRFLAKHGETPANLIAAFEIAREQRWLDRALELFPNSPIVLMKAIEKSASPNPKAGEKNPPDPARLALIERFKAADPNNPVPCIFAAQELFNSGATKEAIAEIRAALDRPAFYVYANERMDAAQRLYEGTGLGEIEASALAMFGLTLPHMTAATQTSRMLMDWQKSAAETGDFAAADDALRLTYLLGRTFATPEASRMLIGQLVGISMEARALKALPADAPPAWLTVNPTQRIAEMEQQKNAVRDIAAGIEQVLQSHSTEILSEYLRRMRNEGEPAAYAWLKAQKN